jgi:hypothetical protein
MDDIYYSTRELAQRFPPCKMPKGSYIFYPDQAWYRFFQWARDRGLLYPEDIRDRKVSSVHARACRASIRVYRLSAVAAIVISTQDYKTFAHRIAEEHYKTFHTLADPQVLARFHTS